MAQAAGFRFRIRPEGRAWRWATIDSQGRICGQGAAPSRAIAAACVIRAIARDSAPESAAA